MVESELLPEKPVRTKDLRDAQGFDRLKELMRHGYFPDPRALPGKDGLWLRHDTAPDLVVRPDGSVDVPLGQPLKRQVAAVTPHPPQRKRKLVMGFLILMGMAAYTFFAIAVLAGIFEGF